MKQRSTLSKALAIAVVPAAVALLSMSAAPTRADSDDGKFQVHPGVYDPANTDLVQSVWLSGIGCPSGATVAMYPATKPTGTYTDSVCAKGDAKDKDNEGLLLAKTGPYGNNAAGIADLKGLPKNVTLTELGYDLRKPGANQNDPRGSHCGGGAPRFNIQTSTGSYFLACNSPSPAVVTPGAAGWMRLRWGGTVALQAFNASHGYALETVSGTVQSIQIVFDEGDDTGPDNTGVAILDNIDVNGVLVGHGPSNAAH